METTSARSARSTPLRPTAVPGSGGSRSFKGCYTCRKRRIKCDERQPACRQCRRAGVTCGGYVKNIIFDFELRARGKETSGPAHFRRPFSTEHERGCMSRWLISAVAPGATAKVLRLLDDDAEAMLADGSHGRDCTRGPFSAFPAWGQVKDRDPSPSDLTRQSLDLSQSSEDPSEPTQHDQVLEDDIAEIGLEQIRDDWHVSPWPQCEAAPITEQEHHDAYHMAPANIDIDEEAPTTTYDLFGEGSAQITADMERPFCDQVAPNAAFEPGLVARISSTLENNFWDPNLATAEDLFRSPEMPLIQDDFYPAAVGVTSTIPSFMNAHQNPILVQAIPLLKHYGSSVIASISPFRHNNTPWHIMFLAQLKTCLASLTLREALDEAGLTTFYGSLAISALSLGMISQSQMWLDHSVQYQRQACTYARAVLRKPYIELDADEYKSALIALLTMAQMALFSGKQDQTEGFLLETEKLVRLRGLAKKKTRKMRLLHHCYVHMRLFHESIFVASGGAESSHRRDIRQAVESSGLSSSSDNLSFRLLHWNDLLREMTVVKDQIEGENDLHIARPGLFPSTMYPEIFGIPETCFFFWSQIIRLGNEKDLAEQDTESDPTPLRGFTNRAKAIERGINQLQDKALVRQEDDSRILTSLLDGMQSALRLYFYRRIYDVSSSMLQPIVISVRNWLFDYDQANPDFLHGSFGLMWPAFIAACEADGAELQSSFRLWFRNAARRSGLGCFSENARLVEQVWEARRGDNKDDVSWLDVVGRGRAQGAGPALFT
ncbi:unnamed protein product [Discula destructiva]